MLSPPAVGSIAFSRLGNGLPLLARLRVAVEARLSREGRGDAGRCRQLTVPRCPVPHPQDLIKSSWTRIRTSWHCMLIVLDLHPATLEEASQEDPDSPFRGPDSKKLARSRDQGRVMVATCSCGAVGFGSKV